MVYFRTQAIETQYNQYQLLCSFQNSVGKNQAENMKSSSQHIITHVKFTKLLSMKMSNQHKTAFHTLTLPKNGKSKNKMLP